MASLLFQISVVQRMKANHNYWVIMSWLAFVVPNISCSKNESKSQPADLYIDGNKSCSKYQLFKE